MVDTVDSRRYLSIGDFLPSDACDIDDDVDSNGVHRIASASVLSSISLGSGVVNNLLTVRWDFTGFIANGTVSMQINDWYPDTSGRSGLYVQGSPHAMHLAPTTLYAASATNSATFADSASAGVRIADSTAPIAKSDVAANVLINSASESTDTCLYASNANGRGSALEAAIVSQAQSWWGRGNSLPCSNHDGTSNATSRNARPSHRTMSPTYGARSHLNSDDAYKTSTPFWTVCSDRRATQEIKKMECDATNTIEKLKFDAFSHLNDKHNSKSGQPHIGCMADGIAEIKGSEECVRPGSTGISLGVGGEQTVTNECDGPRCHNIFMYGLKSLHASVIRLDELESGITRLGCITQDLERVVEEQTTVHKLFMVRLDMLNRNATKK